MSTIAARSIRAGLRMEREAFQTSFNLYRTIVIRKAISSPVRYTSRTFAAITSLPSSSSSTHEQSYAAELQPFSARTLPETKGLFLISVPSPSSQWGSVIEKEDKVVGAASLNTTLRDAQIRVLAIHEGQERYSARLYRPDGTVAKIRHFNEHALDTTAFKDLISGKSSAFKPNDEAEVLVCTHTARDCRCGDIGGDLVHTLRQEAKKKGIQVKVSECSHVGGHKFAANAVLLPSMHMLSNLRPSDASPLLKHLQNLEGRGEQPEDRNMWDHFRGAFGHTIGEQVSMYEWNTAGKKDVEVDDRQATNMMPRRRGQQLRGYSTSALAVHRRRTSNRQRNHSRPNFRTYSTGPGDQTTDPPKSQGVGGKLKELMKKYGRHALAVYLALSAVDFGIAFLGVHLIGAERLNVVKDMIMEQWHKIRPVPENDETVIEKVDEAADKMLENAQPKKRSSSAMIWAEAALAYTIHKTLFLPVRVGLTAAWTPKLVKWLTARGWIGKGGMTRAAAHAQDKVKDAQAKVKEASSRIRQKSE